ncbi:alpha/beta hydrolase [Cernens ardua]|uniref:alpha/beta hydrolase n=1 Tax=Cernens ardua TaxID=3402176 RepID=UPI003F9CB44B
MLISITLSASAYAWPVGHVLPQGQDEQLWPANASHVGEEEKSIRGNVVETLTPHMVIYSPPKGKANGTAVLIMGGGGYHHIEIGREALPAARWLTAEGITAAVLYYRLPSARPHHTSGLSTGTHLPLTKGTRKISTTAPFQDAQRAMRLLRTHATQWDINPQRIGVMGFSAGGNLAAITATRFQHDFYQPVDTADRASSRPDFAILLYPVITLQAPYNHNQSSRIEGATTTDAAAYSAQLYVTKETPPMFLAQAADDPISNVHNSEMMFAALQSHHIPAELHVFEKGGHGWGLKKHGEVAIWPHLAHDWLQENGYLNAGHDTGQVRKP